jgi:hypothetical protein
MVMARGRIQMKNVTDADASMVATRIAGTMGLSKKVMG